MNLEQIKKFVESHGFDCYISTDQEVVIRMPLWIAKHNMLSYETIGVRTLPEAQIAIGY